MFTVEYDERTGIVRCAGSGFMSVETIREVGPRVHAACDRARREHGRMCMLVYSPGAVVQSGEVMEQVGRNGLPIKDARDRMAVVVESSLVKLQATRTLRHEQIRLFATEAEATAWLRSDIAAAA